MFQKTGIRIILTGLGAIAIAILYAVLVSFNLIYGLGLFSIFCSLIIAFLCFRSIEAGLYINIFYSFFIYYISRLFFNDQFPVGLVSDGLILCTFFGLFFKLTDWKKSINNFIANPIAICILILFCYMFIELFNPYAHSFTGWYQAFRKIISSVLLLFIGFNLFSNYAIVKRFIIFVFFVCTIAGFYGCVQQWHGLFDFERAWAIASEKRFVITYIGSDFRKFSTFSDATAYGVLMTSAAVFFMIIGLGQRKWLYRLILFTGVGFMILGMAYSGTRTANAMLVGGLFMYCLLTFNKRSTQVFGAIMTIVFVALIYGPFYGNATLNRFRSTFHGSKDASYLVRENNRKVIQPYIWSHPIGGGIGTTGGAGLQYNPGHYLAGFPPDSGYLKKALESGWIGLIINLILYFIIMQKAINGFFTVRNDRIRWVAAACVSAVFSFYIAEFPQDAIGQITDIVIYFPMVAIIMNIKMIDNFENENSITV